MHEALRALPPDELELLGLLLGRGGALDQMIRTGEVDGVNALARRVRFEASR